MARQPKQQRRRTVADRRSVTSAINGRKGGHPFAPLPEPPTEKLDELDALGRMLARLDAATEQLYKLKIGRRERDKEVRANARVMASIIPKARLRRAERTVRGEVSKIAAPVTDPPTVPMKDGED